MTFSARQRSVGAGERIPGVLQVVELGVEPTIERMATGAIGGKAHSNVIEDGGLEILLMARVATRGQPHKLAHSGLFVALLALHYGMRPEQRKTVRMVAYGLQ